MAPSAGPSGRTSARSRRRRWAPSLVLAALLAAGCASSAAPPDRAPDGSADPSPVTPSTAPSPSAPSPSAPVTSAPPSPSPAGPTSDAPSPAVVALGDSVAAGVGAADPATQGYVPVLARRLPGALTVRSLAVPGATTASLQTDQLPEAVRLLRSGTVRLVTVTIGGNDVFLPVLQACAAEPGSTACATAVTTAVAGADAGLDVVLGRLADAAGPGTVVAVMTYYDPLPACRLAPLQPLAARVLEGSPEQDGTDQDGLNDVLRARAAQHGAVVVETADRLEAPDDLVGGWDCLHPSTSGHARIAEAFADVVAERLD